MSRTAEELLVEAAASCDECLCWLQHCGAECCRVFTFYLAPNSDVESRGDVVRIHAPLTEDLRHYYELHGATVDAQREIISVPRAACEFTATRLAVRLTCRELRDDLLCGIHDAGQPECCADFTAETAACDEWVVTPRCLFAYKTRTPGASAAEPSGPSD